MASYHNLISTTGRHIPTNRLKNKFKVNTAATIICCSVIGWIGLTWSNLGHSMVVLESTKELNAHLLIVWQYFIWHHAWPVVYFFIALLYCMSFPEWSWFSTSIFCMEDFSLQQAKPCGGGSVLIVYILCILFINPLSLSSVQSYPLGAQHYTNYLWKPSPNYHWFRDQSYPNKYIQA